MSRSLLLRLSRFLPGCKYYVFKQQLDTTDSGPVVLVNKFSVAEANQQQFLHEFSHVQQFMRQQPGYLSSQLRQPVGDSRIGMNFARWQSVAALKAALTKEDFKKIVSNLPGRPDPMLFREITLDYPTEWFSC